MVMSQGTYAFLACFSGFWLVWATVVMLCCFCSFLQRRLKRGHEQCLRSVEMEPLTCQPSGLLHPPPPLPHTISPLLPLLVPHPLPQATWVSVPDAVIGKPPCYEEAVLMEDSPPSYSEVLADPRGGTYLKPTPVRRAPPPWRENQDPTHKFTSESRKLPPGSFPDRAYSSLMRLPLSQHSDSPSHLLSNVDLNHNNLIPPANAAMATNVTMATMPLQELRPQYGGLGLRGGTQGFQGGIQGFPGGFQGLHEVHRLESMCGLPTAIPLLGCSTAV